MARAMTQIEQDKNDLEQEVVAIAHELNETYREYLNVLGSAVQQQITLTTYHLCTQAYPKRFLKLSLVKRQTLQQSIQDLGREIGQGIIHSDTLQELTKPFFKETDGVDEESLSESESEKMLRNLSTFVRKMLSDDSKSKDDNKSGSPDDNLTRLSNDADLKDSEPLSQHLETIIIPENFSLDFLTDANLASADQNIDNENYDHSEFNENDSDKSDFSNDDDFSVHVEFDDDEDETNAMMMAIQEVMNTHVTDADDSETMDVPSSETESEGSLRNSDEPDNSDQPPESPMTPIQPTPKALLKRCQRLEKSIRSLIQKATDQTNQILQKSGILSKKLPDAVLEAALKSDVPSQNTKQSPNVLNLLVETSGNRDKPKIMQVTAVRLRVEELEFNNPTLMAWRSRIRELLAQLQTMDKRYRKVNHEKDIADAESTWRSTWYESDG